MRAIKYMKVLLLLVAVVAGECLLHVKMSQISMK